MRVEVLLYDPLAVSSNHNFRLGNKFYSWRIKVRLGCLCVDSAKRTEQGCDGHF